VTRIQNGIDLKTTSNKHSLPQKQRRENKEFCENYSAGMLI